MEAAADRKEISQRITEQPRRAWWRGLLFGLILAAVTIFAYRPAWNGGFLWDDDVYITNNELLTAPEGLRRIWFSLDSPSQYFPLVYTTFRIEHAALGTELNRLSLGQSSAACCQRPAGVAGAGAVKGPGSMAGWSNFCSASRAGGIGRLDHGTQKCAHGLLLFAHATCLDCVC